jgi:thiol:disulfide interchange protein DsbC
MSRPWWGVLFVAGLSLPACAADGDTDKVREALAKHLPDMPIPADALRASPIAGFYELRVGANVVYVSADGRYILRGDLIDLEKQANLTEERRRGLIKEAIASIGENNMIVFGPRKAKRTITVFTDVNCPYCQKFHKEVPALNAAGIRVQYLLFPALGEDSMRKAVAIWCAKDRAAALARAKAREPIEMKTCENTVAQQAKLGQSIGVEATPTIVLDDGHILRGYLPASELISGLGLATGEKKPAR